MGECEAIIVKRFGVVIPMRKHYINAVLLPFTILFLRMQAVLHVSKSATQEIINEFHEIGILAGELSKNTVEAVS